MLNLALSVLINPPAFLMIEFRFLIFFVSCFFETGEIIFYMSFACFALPSKVNGVIGTGPPKPPPPPPADEGEFRPPMRGEFIARLLLFVFSID